LSLLRTLQFDLRSDLTSMGVVLVSRSLRH
jgi:hypothetical protein